MKAILAALVAAMALACAPDAASAKTSGVRAEARIGWETPTVSEDGSVYKIDSNISYGGEIGADAKMGRLVSLGVYGAYEKSSVKLCDGGACLAEDGNLGVGARITFALGRKAQVYGKLGYARIRFTASAGGATASTSSDGVQGAIGVDFDVAPHVYVLAEVNYADYGKFYGINLQRRHVATGVGVRF